MNRNDEAMLLLAQKLGQRIQQEDDYLDQLPRQSLANIMRDFLFTMTQNERAAFKAYAAQGDVLLAYLSENRNNQSERTF